MAMAKDKVFVAMSGGVDSSVAALLLKKKGCDVIGVFMRCWSQGSSDACGIGASCSAEQDAEDARRVAEKLGIPFYVWDFEEEYKKKVIDYMIEGYRQGITPNPDVMCNREIKFGLFLDKALTMGADYVATGHYARIKNCELRIANKKNTKTPLFIIHDSLFTAKDLNKDQSYFLWTLTQNQLKHCLFPIGDYLKPEVREIARKAGLPTADKKDSQGICFLGKVTLGDFLKQYLPEKRGAVFTAAGEKVGEHDGAHFYTIGQRHLGINLKINKGGGDKKPFYVSEKNTETNALIVAEGDDNPSLYKKEIGLGDINFITSKPKTGLKVLARVRYRQPLAKANLLKLKTINYKLIFDQPQKFVASGQSAVFYSKRGEMLGGGVIL